MRGYMAAIMFIDAVIATVGFGAVGLIAKPVSQSTNPLTVWYGFEETGPLAPPLDPSAVVPFVPSRAAVIPEAEGYKVERPCSRRSPGAITAVWRPDSALVARIEKALAPLVQGALERSPWAGKVTGTADAYYRQYVGVVIDGRRIVYVNAFRSPGGAPISWELRLATMCDGGELSFGVEYDVEADRLQHLAFNSRAVE